MKNKDITLEEPKELRRVVIVSTNGNDVKVDKQEVSNLELEIMLMYIRKMLEGNK
jgi:hypothetical protein